MLKNPWELSISRFPNRLNGGAILLERIEHELLVVKNTITLTKVVDDNPHLETTLWDHLMESASIGGSYKN